MEDGHPVFEWFDQVFLITPLIDEQDQLLRRLLLIVRDIEAGTDAALRAPSHSGP